MDLMSLMIRIGADITGAQKGIDDVQKGMEKAEKTSTSFGSKMKNGFAAVAKGAAGLAAGVTAAAAAVVKLTTSAAATTDRIDKMSQKIGISREAFQEMDFIMSQSGGSVESLQAGMKTLRTSMQAAANGTKESVAQFRALGVQIKDNNGNLRSQEDVMFDTIAALQSIDNETERAAMATQMFGRAGTELIPLLNSGAGSIEEMKNKAHELGLVLNDEAIDSGVKLTDTIDQVKRSFDAVITKIGVSFMPIVQRILDFVLQSMPTIQSVLNGFFGILRGLVEGAVNVIQWLYNSVKSIFSNIWDSIGGFVTNVFDSVQSFVDRVKWAFEVSNGSVMAFFGFLTMNGPKWLGDAWNAICGFIENMQSVWADLKVAAEDFWTNTLVPFGEFLAGTFASAWESIKNTVTQFWTTTLVPLATYISGLFTQAWNGIVTFFTQTLPTAIETVQQHATYLWLKVLAPFGAYLSDVFSKAWQAISDFFTTTLPAAIETVREVLSAFYTEIIQPIAQFVGHALLNAWTSIKDYWVNELAPGLAGLQEAFQTFWDNVLVPLATFLSGAFTTVWNGIVSLFGGEGGVESETKTLGQTFADIRDKYLMPVASFITGVFGLAWENLKTALNGLISFVTNVFKGDWKGAWDSIVNTFGTVFDTLKDKLKAPINAVIRLLNQMISKIESAVNSVIGGVNSALSISIPAIGFWDPWGNWRGTSAWSWSPNLSTVSWGRIQELAEGGIVREGGRAIVGEAGYPEYLRVVNGQAIVTPMKDAAQVGGDQITFNIYQQPGQNSRELAEIIQEELVRIGRQKRAVFA